ncbi:MAG: NAD(P)/FAD-dependent oxidoreductase [Candidatus Obscuribacterales bacterium]|nr:NAD(P)/FAD-dependent oxidoreductase [Candidatus Obscuribacterales bacterium]
MNSTATAGNKNLQALKNLEDSVRKELDFLSYPSRDWVIPRQDSNGKRVYDVLIIGGGQSGLTAAFGLKREKVNNILVVDENDNGLEGPWLTFARMHTLRTPKHLTGPDLGIPSLTTRAWYEAQYGAEAWNNLIFLPKEQWAEYLQWYRKILELPVRNNTAAGAIEWSTQENCLSVPLTNLTTKKTEIVYARKVILATGIDGSGRWDIPKQISDNLPKHLYAHTRDPIDFASLKGKSIAVLGAGASAFDNASLALETGAKEIHLFYRRKNLPNINAYRWAEFVGFLKHHGELSDDLKWRFIRQILRMGQLPPTDTYARAKKHPNFLLHGDSPWNKLEEKNGKVIITTPHAQFTADFVIIGTGCVTDLSLRPELKNIVSEIALWQDRYTPPKGEEQDDLTRHPYLSSNFQFQEKTPGKAPYLSSIYNFTFGGLASLGFGGASISGMKYSIPRLVAGITRQLYTEDAEAHLQTLLEFNIKEF